MTKRLAVIIAIGVVLIIATYFLTKPPEDNTPFPEQISKPAIGGTAGGGTSGTATPPATTPATGTTPATETTTPAGTRAPTAPGSTPATDSTIPAPGTPDANKSSVPLQNQQGLNIADGLKNALSQALSIPGGPNSGAQATPDHPEDESYVPMPAVIDASDKTTVLMQARALAGRRDPFKPISARKPFPRVRKGADDLASSAATDEKGPKSAKSLLDENSDALPPPPDEDSKVADAPDAIPSQPAGITSDELPPPPDKPLLAEKLKLNGIVGNRAILAFRDKSFRRENGWRPYVTLGPGERFDSVKLVAINDESVVLEEEGQQSTLVLPPIR